MILHFSPYLRAEEALETFFHKKINSFSKKTQIWLNSVLWKKKIMMMRDWSLHCSNLQRNGGMKHKNLFWWMPFFCSLLSEYAMQLAANMQIFFFIFFFNIAFFFLLSFLSFVRLAKHVICINSLSIK